MAAPTNVFYLVDDYSNVNLGGSSGQQISPEYTAPTQAAANAVAQTFATLFQRAVRLVPKYNALAGAPYTAFNPSTTSLALSTAPSGISY